MAEQLLHKESRPFAWSELVDTQKDAVRQVHRLMDEIRSELEARARRSANWPKEHKLVELTRIDEMRSNRVISIDGRRGSGKTSVLVSIVDLWSRAAVGTLPDGLDEDIGKILERLAILPTAIVDLQPLPESAHLMLHVCGHLRQFVKLVKDDEASERDYDDPASEKAWQSFSLAAAKVWQPRNDRSSRLPPEDLAEELADIEAYRLELNTLFQDFVNALLSDLRGPLELEANRTVLLVVPIDDADLNPWRAPEILELIRWLHHPQVVFLLAGDTMTFERVVYADLVSKLSRPFRGLPITEARFDRVYDRETLRALANDVYHKIVPPSHSVRIQLLSAEQRLERPEVAPALRAIPLGVTIDTRMLARLNDPVPSSLFEYLQAAGLAAALPAALRRLFQFVETLPRLARWAGPTVLNLNKHALSRTDLVDKFGGVTETTVLELLASVRFLIPTDARRSFPRSKGRRPRFAILTAGAGVTASKGEGREQERLSPELAHCLMLFADLDALRLKVDNAQLPVCKAVLCVAGARLPAQEWPLPRFRYHLEQRAFLRFTKQLLETCGTDEERFVAWYLGAVLQLRDEASAQPIEQRDSDWVISQALSLFLRGDTRDACEVVEVAAPEFGMSIALAKRWLELAEEMFGRSWESFVKTLGERRHERVGGDRRAWPSELAGHPWRRMIEEGVIERFIDLVVALESDGRRLSNRHLRGLRRIGQAEARFIMPVLEQMKKPGGHGPALLEGLWKGLPHPAGWTIHLEGGAPWVAPERAPRSALTMSEERLKLTDAVEIVRLSFAGDREARSLLARGVWLAVSVVHELAWDFVVDADPVHAIDPKEPIPWLGVRVVSDEGDPLWPVPAFATFVEIAHLCESWNQIFRLARELTRSGNGQDVVDRVARTFIEDIADVGLGVLRQRRERLAASNPAAWALTVTRIEEALPANTRAGDRRRSFETWRETWRVFAAPELGLSDKAAEGILKGLDAETDQAELEALQITRRRLCEGAGIKPDNSRKDHPWLRVVEHPAKTSKRRPRGK
jgi:hypothetical protein